jgi:TetR/AcrR family fatty acid metabolism transcriptional regulator
LRTVLVTFSKHRRLSKILLVEAVGLGHGFDEALMHARGHFAAMIQGYLDKAVASGALAPFDTELASWAWFGAINEIVVRWLVTGQRKELESVLPDLRGLLLRSVGAPTDGAAPAERGHSA